MRRVLAAAILLAAGGGEALGAQPGAPATRPAAGGGAVSDPAPRPSADVRIQNRLVSNASAIHLFGGIDYLERRDFYISPGVRAGASYYLGETLGLEVQGSHYFSRLNQAGRQVEETYGAIPDSRAPSWLFVAGLRAALGYGKVMMSGLSSAIHFQPQALLQAGFHVHEGSLGPSALGGIGILVHATPRLFVRLDGAVSLDYESRSMGRVAAFGFLPSLVVGGAL